jgi:hypothetical protein
MFSNTMTFRADYGTNLSIEGANATKQLGWRADARRSCAAPSTVTECTRVADDWGELNDDIFIGIE